MPTAPQESAPPAEQSYLFPPLGGYAPPGVLVIPPLPPTPPCVDNPATPEDECNPPPPVDVPEPGTLLILIIGVAVVWAVRLRPIKARVSGAVRHD